MTEACLIVDECERVDLDQFLPTVLFSAPGVDHEIAAYYVREAAIQFCSRSRLLRQTLEVELQPCVENPLIEPRCDDLRIVAIHQVCGRALRPNEPCCSWGGCSVVYDGEVTLMLSPPPSNSQPLRPLPVTVSVAPLASACSLPTVLFERHRETIAAGARAMLFKVPGTQFYDLRAAAEQDRLFTAGITGAGIDRLTGYGFGSIKMRLRHHRIV